MIRPTMADLEKLAVRRDRGYLLRLLLLMGVAVLISLFLFGWLTGARVSGCVSGTIVGTESTP